MRRETLALGAGAHATRLQAGAAWTAASTPQQCPGSYAEGSAPRTLQVTLLWNMTDLM